MGLTPFLYIPIRLAQESGFITDFVYLNGYEVQSPRWYRWYLSAEEFTTTKLFDTPLVPYPALIVSYMQSYGKNLSPASSILAVAGLGLVIFTWLKTLGKNPPQPDRRSQKERRKAETKARRSAAPRAKIWLCLFSKSPRNNRLFDTVLLVAFLCTLFPVLSYLVPDRDVFFMPSFFFLTAFVGMGLHRINRSITARLPHRLSFLGELVIALTIPLYLFLHHFLSSLKSPTAAPCTGRGWSDLKTSGRTPPLSERTVGTPPGTSISRSCAGSVQTSVSIPWAAWPPGSWARLYSTGPFATPETCA